MVAAPDLRSDETRYNDERVHRAVANERRKWTRLLRQAMPVLAAAAGGVACSAAAGDVYRDLNRALANLKD